MCYIGKVAQVITLPGRGIVLLFGEPPSGSLAGTLLVMVERPDGSTIDLQATVEHARTARAMEAGPGEELALSIRGATREDVPIGSVCTVLR
jgi:hypothetical protein